MNNIDKLKEITDQLTDVPTLDSVVLSRDIGQHSIQYDVAEGTSFGYSLLNRDAVAVMELFISKGTEFPQHLHQRENEWLIVYKGSMKIIKEKEEIIINKGEAIQLKPNEPHSSITLEDTWLIAISIPRIEGFAK